MSQKEVAKHLGLDTSTYNKKENGRNPFSSEELKKIKLLFELNNEDFIDIFFNSEGDFKSHKSVS